MSKLRLFFLLIFDGVGGYLSGEDAGDDGVVLGGGGGYLYGEDGRCRRGAAEAAADRDGGGVVIGDEGGVHRDGVGQDSISLEPVEDAFSGGDGMLFGRVVIRSNVCRSSACLVQLAKMGRATKDSYQECPAVSLW